jgi:Holliday junction resolvase-like predicted endonuclease
MKKNRHDRYVDELVEKIKEDYDSIETHVRIFDKVRKSMELAEADVLARRGNTVDVFEVKFRHREAKAGAQLARIRGLMPEVRNTYLFVAESGRIERIDPVVMAEGDDTEE